MRNLISPLKKFYNKYSGVWPEEIRIFMELKGPIVENHKTMQISQAGRVMSIYGNFNENMIDLREVLLLFQAKTSRLILIGFDLAEIKKITVLLPLLKSVILYNTELKIENGIMLLDMFPNLEHLEVIPGYPDFEEI